MPTRSLWLLPLLFGCATRTLTEADPARQHPDQAPIVAHVDVVAQQDGTRLTLWNRTATRYANVNLWLNQQYVAPLDQLDVGETRTLDLAQFRNAYGEPYPLGNLLATDKRLTLWQAEFHDPAANTRRILMTRERKRGLFGL